MGCRSGEPRSFVSRWLDDHASRTTNRGAAEGNVLLSVGFQHLTAAASLDKATLEIEEVRQTPFGRFAAFSVGFAGG